MPSNVKFSQEGNGISPKSLHAPISELWAVSSCRCWRGKEIRNSTVESSHKTRQRERQILEKQIPSFYCFFFFFFTTKRHVFPEGLAQSGICFCDRRASSYEGARVSIQYGSWKVRCKSIFIYELLSIFLTTKGHVSPEGARSNHIRRWTLGHNIKSLEGQTLAEWLCLLRSLLTERNFPPEELWGFSWRWIKKKHPGNWRLARLISEWKQRQIFGIGWFILICKDRTLLIPNLILWYQRATTLLRVHRKKHSPWN